LTGPTLGLVVCSAGAAELVRARLEDPAPEPGWTVAVTLTPTVATWMAADEEPETLAEVTGLPVRCEPRLHEELSPDPRVGCAVVLATANTGRDDAEQLPGGRCSAVVKWP
jgi:hypothetical protein